MSPTDVRETVAAVWRMEAARIVATLTRAVGDVGRAEDLAQEALVDALDQWPRTGVPRNPGAWLTTVAKRKAVDQWRRQDNLDAKYALLARELADHVDEAWDPDRIDDDVLRLMFMASLLLGLASIASMAVRRAGPIPLSESDSYPSVPL